MIISSNHDLPPCETYIYRMIAIDDRDCVDIPVEGQYLYDFELVCYPVLLWMNDYNLAGVELATNYIRETSITVDGKTVDNTVYPDMNTCSVIRTVRSADMTHTLPMSLLTEPLITGALEGRIIQLHVRWCSPLPSRVYLRYKVGFNGELRYRLGCLDYPQEIRQNSSNGRIRIYRNDFFDVA